LRILGVNFGHAAAAALIEDGKILAAIEEEELSRIKGDRAFPKKAAAFVCKKNNLSYRDIDIIAVGCENLTEFGYGYRKLNQYFNRSGKMDKFWGLFYDGLKRLFPTSVNLSRSLRKLFLSSLSELGFPPEKVRFVDHHEAHAASAYYTSPWRDAVIVTNDGKGDGLCGIFCVGKDGIMKNLDRVEDLNSIGQFYQSVTKFLGYKVNRHEGKITGLAAFGDDAESFPLMNQVYRFDNGIFENQFHKNEEFRRDPIGYFERHVSPKNWMDIKYLKSLHGKLVNFAVAYQMYANYLKEKMGTFPPKDIAAGIQKLSEEAIVAYIRGKLNSDSTPHICLAGGVFANVKINQRIREIDQIKNVYVHPAMDDSGTALGAALLTWMNSTAQKVWPSLETVYLGPDYSEQEMEQSLKKYNLPYRRPENFEEELGRLIYEGKIIGRYNGAMEWGPRALGNRSILARPTDKAINDTLNQRLQRTEFMPFAPSMIDEDTGDFLEDYSHDHIAAKYMTITYNVVPSAIDRIQAAVHIDGTARPQVVFEKDNPTFYNIIKAYKKHSGFGVVINTSFNMHEEPIVNSPENAISAFLVGAVDVLSMGPFIVDSNSTVVNN